MFEIETENIGKKSVIGVIVLIVLAIALTVLTPAIVVWVNLWLLNNTIYRWTSLEPVPSWVVYLVSMLFLLCTAIASAIASKRRD